MKVRRDLDAEKKSRAKIRYLPSWPFVELKVGDDDPIRPKTTLARIANQVLGVNPYPNQRLLNDLSKFKHHIAYKNAAKGKG